MKRNFLARKSAGPFVGVLLVDFEKQSAVVAECLPAHAIGGSLRQMHLGAHEVGAGQNHTHAKRVLRILATKLADDL